MVKLTLDPTITPADLAPAKDALEKIKTDSMAGWLDVPVDDNELMRIKRAANKINSDSDYLVCIGIGGSYLGHKAVIDALGQNADSNFPKRHARTKILFAGNSLSSTELQNVLSTIDGHDFSINVISKSGTTLEPAIAFRILKDELIKKYGAEQAATRIYATTDANKGALHDEAASNNYQSFVVPDNIGGRYSVLTAVGLLPLAAAGIDIDALLQGAKDSAKNNFDDIARYAITRQNLYKEQKRETEVLACFEPRFATFAEWWKQLFGESEGKNQQGIFPASVTYTTDLHSLGQYLQQGSRELFETVVKITTPSPNNNQADQPSPILVQKSADNADGLNYLAGKSMDEINAVACEATIKAHRDGGIPVLEITLPDLTEYTIGQLIYFFELSCAISATISEVNPFDQPGVEAYKKNMFESLGKPAK